nr:cell division protein ZapA [Psychrobacter sp. PraFG1]UNK06585.1 cell division protein ZapA [Psychrobacter sp. PraFG1]
MYSASQFINSFIQDLQANAPQLPQENLLVLCCLNLYEKMQQAKLQAAANESDIAQANELLEHMIREMQLSD